MNENPWAYSEARNRIREQQDKEKLKKEVLEDFVEKQEKLYIRNHFDVHELQRRIETGRSLTTLRSDIDAALKEGIISREAFDLMQDSIDSQVKKDWWNNELKDKDFIWDIPFSDNRVATFFEEYPIWKNILVDIAGFWYGFFVQGGAILTILIWRVLMDLLFLPRDSIEYFSHKKL